MKSKEEILYAFGLGLDSITEHYIFKAMEAYADQFRKWRTDPPPKDVTHIIGDFGGDLFRVLYKDGMWQGIYVEDDECWNCDPDGWIPVPE